ncbi:MAG: chloride channel protein [Symbiopectobacterium sp.]
MLASGLCDVLSLAFSDVSGGGFAIIPDVTAAHYSAVHAANIFVSDGADAVVFLFWLGRRDLCADAGVGHRARRCLRGYIARRIHSQSMGIRCWHFCHYRNGRVVCGFSTRAPLTGIVVVLEMTDNYQLILPMIITCLGATLMAQFLGEQPLYSAILARILQRQNALEQRSENEHKAKL